MKVAFLFLTFFYFSLPNSPLKAFEFNSVFKMPTKNKETVKVIDARSRNRWLKGRLPNAVYLDWEQLSQPGAGSRGSLRQDPQVLADDLARAGFHINDTVYIYGKGVFGEGNEGRIAWLLYGLGFTNIHVTDFIAAKAWSGLPLEKGPYFPSPVTKWQRKLRDDLTLTLQDFKSLKSKSDKKFVLMDLRGKYANTKLPGIFHPSDLNINWKLFLTQPQLVQSIILDYYEKNNFDKDILILPISFAGLRSSYVSLLLKSWGFNPKVIPEGFSIELK